jgi:hypothetical protein
MLVRFLMAAVDSNYATLLLFAPKSLANGVDPAGPHGLWLSLSFE